MNTPSSKKKTLKFALFITSIILLATIVGGHEYLRSKVPQMSGELKIKRLSSSVSVVRDRYGVPHIEAKNNEDAFRVLGFVMASERLFQMEMSRRFAQGELAEVVGSKALPSDKLFRNLGLKSESERLFNEKKAANAFDPEMLKEAEAFYDGINQFIETSPMPLEFAILGIKPRPFTVVDGQSFIGLMAFSFGSAIMTEPLLSKLAKTVGEDLVEDLRNEKIPAKSTRVVNIENQIPTYVSNVIKGVEQGFTLFEGSNGWLLSGKRSQSGAPLFANDPHISYSLPGVWFEAHVKTPTYETYGHFLSLVPFPVLSHNRERGWGLTMSLTDDMDIYKETIDAKNKTYLYKGEQKPLEIRDEVIKVKKGDDYKMQVWRTHHGPVLDYAYADPTIEKSLSLQWAFYAKDNDTMSALFQMGRAKSMDEFKKAVSLGKAPGLNILYADRTNIGWWMFGEIWNKRPDLKTDFIMDGASGKDEILSIMPFEKKPFAENPESGVIVSANSRPSAYPTNMRGDWQPDDRYKTIDQVLSQKEKWAPEELMEVQTLSMNFENKVILERLLLDTFFESEAEKKSFQKYLDILKGWDLNSSVDSVGASLYYTWTKELQVRILSPLTDDEKEIFSRFPNGWIVFRRLVMERDSLWWKKFDRGLVFKETLKKSIAELEEKLGKDTADWQWGKLHTIEYVHPIGRMKPLDKIFNVGPFPISGATAEVNNQKFNSYKDFQVKAGPSTRRIIDFAHPQKSWGILPLGNSGHMLSPFYNDQAPLFIKGEYRAQLLDLEDSDIRYKMVVNPE